MSDLLGRIDSLSPAKRALLEKLRLAESVPPAASIPIPRRDGPSAPLSWEQRRLWFLHRLAPDGPAYTIPLAFGLSGAVDAALLERALRQVVDRHEALRLAFREEGGEPVQTPGDASGFALERMDLRGGDEEEVLGGWIRRGFDLRRGRPVRALLARTGEDEHVLAIALHHVAADGASAGVMLRELSALYAAGVERRDAALSDPPLQFPDFAAWQRARGVDAAAVAWWRERLDGAPRVLEVPADRPRPAVQSFAGTRHAFALGPALSASVRRLAADERATPFSVLLAAWATVLWRATGEPDLVIGTAMANRDVPGAEGAVGFFANTLPIRIRLAAETPVRALVGHVRRAVTEAQDHARVPFDRIVDALGVARDPGRPPLVQVIASFDPAEEGSLALPGISVQRRTIDTGASPFDLVLAFAEGDGGIRGELHHRTDLYEPETLRRLTDRLHRALRGFVDGPGALVDALPLVDDDETRTVLAWGDGGPPVAEGTIHGMIEAAVRRTPGAVALAWRDQECTCAELNRRANRVAHHLIARGVGPEDRVGVMMARTPALVAAILGVMKAGAAFVPLDTRNPPPRLDAMLRASGARAVLVDAPSRPIYAAMEAGVPSIAAEPIQASSDVHDPRIAVDPEGAAYVMFTSGSTGVPKGVVVRHGGTAAFIGWLRDSLSPAERATMLAGSSIGFDALVAEILAPLSWGGAVVLADSQLAPVPATSPVRSAFLVPGAAAELLATDRLPPGIRTLLLGGEPVPPALVRGLQERVPGLRVLHVYGPTEDSTISTCHQVPPGAETLPLGRPIPGGRVYVLDARMRPCGIGAPGELWLAGAGLARSYAGRRALTAERFVPDPFGAPGSRMYRTLDRARWRNDGTLEFLGRADAQVKVRGQRIEPAEVEAALREHAEVREAAVAVHGEGSARRLAAWVVPASVDHPPSEADLRAFARGRLPDAMVPGAFTIVPQLPRTPSGKLDRRALPAPEATESGRELVAPRTEEERVLAEVWREVLGLERVGVDEGFFDLGGNSLLALRVLALLRERTGVELPVATLLQSPTVAGLAPALTRRPVDVRLPLVALSSEGAAPPLFLVHAGGGHVAAYMRLALTLKPALPVYALQGRGLDDGLEPLGSVEEMAAYYLDGIRTVQPRGPYRLGGWSLGGLVAYEMAQRLVEAGEAVQMLGLLDTGRPEERDAGLALDHASVLRRVLTDVIGWAATRGITPQMLEGLTPAEQLEVVAEKVGERWMPPERLAEVAALTRVRLANHNALVDYVARPYPGAIDYFQSTGSAHLATAPDAISFWSGLARGGFTIHPVGGNHGTLLQVPHVHTLAGALKKALGAA
jgi:amino acid adenylation domain-containing protein